MPPYAPDSPGTRFQRFIFPRARPTLPILFCGGTRFGCGRVFEGTHPMMHAALARLASLPAAHCASELDYGDAVFAAGRAWKDGFRG